MKKQIYKTREAAIEACKEECRAKANGEAGQFSIRDTSTHCGCGETEAVDITMFVGEEQYYASAGICSWCGKE